MRSFMESLANEFVRNFLSSISEIADPATSLLKQKQYEKYKKQQQPQKSRAELAADRRRMEQRAKYAHLI